LTPSDKSCAVSNLWIELEIDYLIGDSKNPVCEFFSLGTKTGCVFNDIEECETSSKFYVDSIDRTQSVSRNDFSRELRRVDIRRD